ncbi:MULTISPECIES: TetR/AcrR family transcriptional regulator [Allobacillus]|uniref:TetR/AcrR family transcriptional regulator n=1 Tax=Allobacillus salarius TaxID=1955272 RepID=A0A556PKR4_9BACI|nr:TetR/AcrR family transcriptional regulator [Allobacillus salarius]TSJ64980.1 TetR/AcrR family transcriptional regulator [Allobacillus salarius]
MHEKFEQLDSNKKLKIIEAALEEFSTYDFQHASTNRIVKNAGIGKGMLFYYFNSKKDLYTYLMHYCLDRIYSQMVSQLETAIQEAKGDFIERYYVTARLKSEYMGEEPHVFNFMSSLILQDFAELPNDIQQKVNTLQQQAYDLLYKDIDLSLFKNDIDSEKALNLVKWSLDGYQQELEQKLKGEQIISINLKEYWDEFYEYLNLLKKVYYQ